MQIYSDPDIARVTQLLLDNDLPAEDLQDNHALQLFACGAGIDAVIGIEAYPGVGLLRSLAVRATGRRRGIARALVEHVEAYAATRGIGELYLLTTTAEAFFLRLGYQPVARTSAPSPIRETREFSDLCPADSAFMCKRL